MIKSGYNDPWKSKCWKQCWATLIKIACVRMSSGGKVIHLHAHNTPGYPQRHATPPPPNPSALLPLPRLSSFEFPFGPFHRCHAFPIYSLVINQKIYRRALFILRNLISIYSFISPVANSLEILDPLLANFYKEKGMTGRGRTVRGNACPLESGDRH